MNTNVQNPSIARKSTACKWGLGLMVLAMGVTGVAAASAGPEAASAASNDVSTASTSVKRSRFGIQFGRASWYGGKFNGRRTASGEKFDMNALTCAHRSLPLGSWVRVTNLTNRKAVFLRVNDRGPVPQSVLLDLSYAAARKLGIGGLAKVKVEPIRPDDPAMTNALVADFQPAPRLLQIDWTPTGVPRLPWQIAHR